MPWGERPIRDRDPSAALTHSVREPASRPSRFPRNVGLSIVFGVRDYRCIAPGSSTNKNKNNEKDPRSSGYGPRLGLRCRFAFRAA